MNIEAEQRTEVVYYLKINNGSETNLKCFWHWVKICEAIGAKYFILVDSDVVRERIKSFYRKNNYVVPENFLSSYRDRLHDVCYDYISPFWINVAYAHLTPYVHAKENNYKHFWAIDADDTILCCKPETCGKLLEIAEDYAISHDISQFSLDMWYSLYRQKESFHWSFGIVFTILNTDYFEAIERGKEIFDGKIPSKTPITIVEHNIDSFFTVLKMNDLLICETFYFEGLWFEHFNNWVNTWENGKIKDILGFYKNTEIAVADEVVKLDYCVSKDESSLINRDEINGNPLLKNLSLCDRFEPYVYNLFSMASDLVIVIINNEDYSASMKDSRKLQILRSLGIETDTKEILGSNWLAIIDGGDIKLERNGGKGKIEERYIFDNQIVDIEFKEFENADMFMGSASVKINEIEYSIRKRGLSFIVWSKKEKRIVDSVCFDINCDKYVRKKVSDCIVDGAEINDYLSKLKDSPYTIFIATKDDASFNLQDSTQGKLFDLGLQASIQGNNKWRAYIAVIEQGKVIFEEQTPDTNMRHEQKKAALNYSGYLSNGVAFSIESRGWYALCNASIQVDGIEYAPNMRGLNIVVYDNKTNTVVDSIAFDTNEYGQAYRQ